MLPDHPPSGAHRRASSPEAPGGAAVWAGLKVAATLKSTDLMVILLPDTGMRYLSKIYNDEWMKGAPVRRGLGPPDGRRRGAPEEGRAQARRGEPTDTLLGALAKMRKLDISQLPVVEKGRPTGVIFEDSVMSRLLKATTSRLHRPRGHGADSPHRHPFRAHRRGHAEDLAVPSRRGSTSRPAGTSSPSTTSCRPSAASPSRKNLGPSHPPEA